MKYFSTIIIVTTLLLPYDTTAQEAFIKLKSVNTLEVTVTKLTNILKGKGMNIFSVIDHQQGAEKAGLELRATTLVIFGNPKVGTKLMQCDQRIGLELPLKIVIWQDQNEGVWVGYDDPSHLANNYNLVACEAVLIKVRNAMANFAEGATS